MRTCPPHPRRAPVPREKRLFLFWTVHGPFSLFLREEKEKMGGVKDQPSSWLNLPARKGGEKIPLLWKEEEKEHL